MKKFWITFIVLVMAVQVALTPFVMNSASTTSGDAITASSASGDPVGDKLTENSSSNSSSIISESSSSSSANERSDASTSSATSESKTDDSQAVVQSSPQVKSGNASAPVQVSTWADFVAKVADTSVSAIQVTADMTATSDATTTARTLAIDFGGHTVTFNQHTLILVENADLTVANLVYKQTAPALTGTTSDNTTNYGVVSGAPTGVVPRTAKGTVTFTGTIQSAAGNTGSLATPVKGRVIFDNANVNIANGNGNAVAINAQNVQVTGQSVINSTYPYLYTNVFNASSGTDSSAKFEPAFNIEDQSTVTGKSVNSPDTTGGQMIVIGMANTQFNVTGSGSSLNLYTDATFSGGSTDGLIRFSAKATTASFNVADGAKVNLESEYATVLNMNSSGDSFKVSGAGTEFNATQNGQKSKSTQSGNSTIRFVQAGNFTFDVSDQAKLNVLKKGGSAPAIRMYGSGNKIAVTSGADFMVENVGDGTPKDSGSIDSKIATGTADLNQAILFTSGSTASTGDFSLTGENANVQVVADNGAAIANPYGTLTVTSSDFTFFVLRGHTASASAGIMSAQTVKFTMGAVNPVSYFDFRNDGGQLINNVSDISGNFNSNSTFTTGNTNLALWPKGTDLDDESAADIYHKVGFTLSGQDLATLKKSATTADVASEATRFNTNFGSQVNYSRMSAINEPAQVDKIRTPTDADRYVYVHAGFPRGKYDDLTPADADEVTISITITDAEGNVVYSGTENTGGAQTIYGKANQKGWAKFDYGKLLKTGDVVHVTSAVLHDDKHGADTINVTASDKTVVDVTPPTPATTDSSAIVLTSSGQTVAITGTGTPGSTVVINHAGDDTKYTGVVGSDGTFSISVSTDGWAVGDKIYVRLEDSAGSATANSSNAVDDPPATNNDVGNINPLVDTDYHDTTFPAAAVMTVVDAQPVTINYIDSNDGTTRLGGKTIAGSSGDTWNTATVKPEYVKDAAGNWYQLDESKTFTATRLDTQDNTSSDYTQENGVFSRQYAYTVNYFYKKIGSADDLTLQKSVKLAGDDDSKFAADIDDVAPGSELTFRIVYRNFAGLSDAALSDVLDNRMSYVPGSLKMSTMAGNQLEAQADPTTVNQNVGLKLPTGLAIGQTVTVEFNAVVNSNVTDSMQSSDGTLTLQNQATVSDDSTSVTSNTVNISVLGKSTITVRYIDRSSDMTNPVSVADTVSYTGPIGQKMSSVSGESDLTPKTVSEWTAVDYTLDSDLVNGDYAFASQIDPEFTSTDQTYTYRYERAMLGVDPDKNLDFGKYRPDAVDRDYFYGNGASSGDVTPFGVNIQDYYGVANWKLSVTQDNQFTTVADPAGKTASSRTSHELTDAQLRFSNAVVKQNDADATNNTPEKDLDAYFTVNDAFSLTPKATATTVLTRINKEALLSSITSGSTSDIDQQWQENWRYEFGTADNASSSVELHVPASTRRYEQAYSSTLTWHITVTP